MKNTKLDPENLLLQGPISCEPHAPNFRWTHLQGDVLLQSLHPKSLLVPNDLTSVQESIKTHMQE